MLFKLGFYKTPDSRASFSCTILFHKIINIHRNLILSLHATNLTFCILLLNSHTMNDIHIYNNITIEAMQHTLGLYPRPFQQDTISHIIRMKDTPSSNHPIQPCLLVQGTSGGKSSVYQMIGIIKGGVTLIIESMLSLSSDQMSKISKISNTTDGVSSIQLDSIKKQDHQQAIVSALQKIPSNTNRTIYLFASPEALTKPIWSNLMKQLILNQTLSLVCIDEVHLFVNFAITFRPSIISLKRLLFDSIHSSNNTNNESQCLKVPILFMTATFNKNMNTLLKKITGLHIEDDFIYWSDASSFSRRNIKIDVSLTVYKMKIIKEQLKQYLVGNDTNKAIIYSNISSQVTSMREKLDIWLDSPDSFDGDTISINGDLPSEWKLISSQLFTNEYHSNHIEQEIDNNVFSPRILLATSGCIGAGLDCSQVVLVLRDGFPTSMVDFIQEMGRCGRSRVNDNNEECIQSTDCFHLILSLNSFTYLAERIYTQTSLTTNELDIREIVITTEESNKFELDNLIEVVCFIFNSDQCWHTRLEELCSRYETNSTVEPNLCQDCNDSCPYCNNTLDQFIKPISKRGLIEFLVRIFIERCINQMTPSMLCHQLKAYELVGTSIYGRRVNTAPPVACLNGTVLQLIGSKILKTEVDRNEDTNELKTIVRLNYIFDDDIGYGQLAYTIDKYWVGFKFIN
jgi:superfamily II DNA helicase RecQ